MNKPFFSVIIPTYNRATFIEKAVHSVLYQTFTDFEIIVVDDASTDNTEEIVKRIKDNRIIYIKNETNKERCITRNIGIQNSKGLYITFLDSDDYHLNNHLEVLYKEIKERSYPKAVFFTNAYNESKKEGRSKRLNDNFEEHNPYRYIIKYTFNVQRVAVHKAIFEVFKFDENIIVCEDMDVFLRINTKFPIYHIKKETTVYFHNPESFTHGDPLKPFKEYDSYKKIFAKKELKNYLPISSKNRLLSMCHYNFAVYYEEQKNVYKMYASIIKSFVLYPLSYNGNTNKVMLIMAINNLPFVSYLKEKLFKK